MKSHKKYKKKQRDGFQFKKYKTSSQLYRTITDGLCYDQDGS